MSNTFKILRYYLPFAGRPFTSVKRNVFETKIFNYIQKSDSNDDKNELAKILVNIRSGANILDEVLYTPENHKKHYLYGTFTKMLSYSGMFWYFGTGTVLDMGVLSIFLMTYANRSITLLRNTRDPNMIIEDVIEKRKIISNCEEKYNKP